MNPTFDLRYVDPFSLLVVGKNGSLKRLYCPFKVICTTPHDRFSENQSLIVEMVRNDPPGSIQYVVGGHVYPHEWFRIPQF